MAFKTEALKFRKTPCKNCQDRHVGCHSRCPIYLEWKKEVDAERVEQQRVTHLIYNPNIKRRNL